MMRALLVAALLLSHFPAAHGASRDWNFRVLLDGREIGRHTFTLLAQGDGQEIRSEASFDVNLLFVNVFRYRHEAAERWQGNCLQELVSRTETNGKREELVASSSGGRLVVERMTGRDEHDGCVMSFAYWNPEILQAKRLLNSQTGELLPVTVATRGKESISVRGRQVQAEHHRISAPNLSIDLWFADGQWVALEAPAKGGKRLRYQLI
jgi:hypothetical protein